MNNFLATIVLGPSAFGVGFWILAEFFGYMQFNSNPKEETGELPCPYPTASPLGQ